MKCGKSYNVTSTNPKMSGSSGSMSYGGSYKYGGMVKSYQDGGVVTDQPKPDMRPYEEQQADIEAQRKKREAEKAAQRKREGEYAEMDENMREAGKRYRERKQRGE